MKRILTAATAALLLGACETAYPPGDPYGAPYPPQDPYGGPGYGQPYPPQAPYGSAPYPQQPDSMACPIASSRDWRAWVDTNPAGGDRPNLVVSGTIVAPTGGYRMEFEPYLQERRSHPVQLVATLDPQPPQGAATQALTTHDVRWQWPLQSGPVGSVTIVCGNQTLAEITPGPPAQ